jgi:cysteine desulfurase
MNSVRNVYLDHSASTPVDARVSEAMLPYHADIFGNSSSAHGYGRAAEKAIEDARETIASIFNCQPTEIIFTSGGSESDNLAIRGVAWSRVGEGRHLVTTPVEHSAVAKTVEQMANVMGFEQTVLQVDRDGQVNLEDLAASLTEQTTIASVIYGNNEVGTITPIPQLARQAKAQGVIFHTDAVQTAGQLTLDVQELGVDLLSISAHKFYGPKGVGALFCRHGIDLVPHNAGGSHESGRRAGTHNTAGIVGMATALKLAYEERAERTVHYQRLRDQLIDSVLSTIPGSALTGHPEHRLPSHASFVFEDIDSSQLLMYLDMKGVAASGGSACKTGNPEPSSVLVAMGFEPELAIGSLRLTVGKDTTEDDISYAVRALTDVVGKLRKLRTTILS